MKFGITGNIDRKEIRESVRKVLKRLEDNSVSFIIDSRFTQTLNLPDSGIAHEELGDKSDMVLAFGGDGTLLYIAKSIGNFTTPILGINTGRFGFLTEITPDELPERINDLLAKRYSIEKRIMMEAFVEGRETRELLAVNDFVIDKGGYPRIIKIALTINNEYFHTYTSNGIIVSTATGSTAYSLSAGGPIIYPTVDNLLITPICPHTLSVRPMIIPGDFSVCLELLSGPEEIPLNADGQRGVMLNPGQKITIKRSNAVLNLVHFPSHNFFRVLSNKLGWGSRKENNSRKR